MDTLAHTEHLLVVSDFDGTLAGFSPDPATVPINTDACAVLSHLASLPRTTVAILSGRMLSDLQDVVPVSPSVQLAGSHGAESSHHPVEVSPEMQATLDAVTASLEALAIPGTYVEKKVVHRVFHVAPLAETDAPAARAALEKAAAIDPAGARVMRGKNIVEFSVSPATKGTWITAERSRCNASAVVFMGDDVTDEHGFAALGDGDLGVKVGAGATGARRRIEFGTEVTEFYQDLYRLRAEAVGATE